MTTLACAWRIGEILDGRRIRPFSASKRCSIDASFRERPFQAPEVPFSYRSIQFLQPVPASFTAGRKKFPCALPSCLRCPGRASPKHHRRKGTPARSFTGL
jgi:hypothetical protein